MKKIILVLSAILLLFLGGCDEEFNDEIISDGDEVIQLDKEISTIEVDGVIYKDINSVDNSNFNIDNSQMYAIPLIDESGEKYIKISENFAINDERKEIEKIEILPSKIYALDDTEKYIIEYNGESYYIPVEKCKSGEERIVYQNFGIEILHESDSIDIEGSAINNVCSESTILNQISLYEAFLSYWKITGESAKMPNINKFAHIYYVDFDDDSETMEFLYPSTIREIHTDNEAVPVYSIISYNKNSGAKLVSNGIEIYNLENVLNYKNVFYGYNAFEGAIGNLIGVKENVIIEYLIYDKELGLMKIDRFSNGEKVNKDGIEKLSNVAFTLNGSYPIQKDYNGNKYIDLLNVTGHAGYIYDVETNEWLVDPSISILEDGTKIYITNIKDNGYELEIKTENGDTYIVQYKYI